MPLNDLISAWQQTKLRNAMDPTDAQEILALIDQPHPMVKTSYKRILVNLVMLLLIIITIQGG